MSEILVIDQKSKNLETKLTDKGFSVSAIENIDDSIDALVSEGLFAMILVERAIFEKKYAQLMQALKNNQSDALVYAMLKTIDLDIIRKMKQLGATGYLRKPLDDEEWDRILQKHQILTSGSKQAS